MPLLLTETTLVKARTFPRKQAPGATFSNTYVMVQKDIGEFLGMKKVEGRMTNGEARRQLRDEAALPVVIIDTFGRPIDMVEVVSGTNRVRVKDRVKAHVTLVTKGEGRMQNDEPIHPHLGPLAQERDDSSASELHASKAEGQRLKAEVGEGSHPLPQQKGHGNSNDQGAGGTTPSRVDYDGWAEVSVRGGSSAAHLKKPFKLELQDESGADLKASLLGMPKESDWILYPSHRDKTFVRDVLAYELWREMGYYAPRWRYVEVFVKTNASPLKGSRVEGLKRDRPHPGPLPRERESARRPLVEGITWGDYAGVYVLMEKIKRGGERVDVERLRAEDVTEPKITGGYIFKKDRVNRGEHGFKSSQGLQFAFEEPKERDLTPAQEQWLTNHINEFERVLFSENFRDLTNGYAKYIDVDSFIDYHWMVEATKNMDGYEFSQFLHKDRGEKLKMGPVWDYDMAFGNTWYFKGYRTNEWRWAQMEKRHYKWYERLFEDPDFLQRYIDRWAELRRTVFATSNVLSKVDALVAEVAHAQVRNFRRWPILGKTVDPSVTIEASYQAEVNWLKRWLCGRLAWIDSQDFPAPKWELVEGSAVPEWIRESSAGVSSARDPVTVVVLLSAQARITKLALTGDGGRIYYTTDGTDPRLPGGRVSPGAKPYTEPIDLRPDTRLFARILSQYQLWSAPLKLDRSKLPEANP